MGYTHGMPTWQHIPAVDVPRAQAFYSSLLGFQFRPEVTTDAENRKTAHFNFPNSTMTDQLQIGGGIIELREGESIVSTLYTKATGHIAPTMYYFVDDLDETLGQVDKLGGKVLVGRMPADEHGDMAVLQDTEGNALGVYGCVKK